MAVNIVMVYWIDNKEPVKKLEGPRRDDMYVILIYLFLKVCPIVLGPLKYLRSTTTQPWYYGDPQTPWPPAHTLWRGEQKVSVYDNGFMFYSLFLDR